MGEITEYLTPPPPAPSFRPMPVREDCWSEDATFTLIEAWGRRYLDLNRGNLRQKQWQEVADAVNAAAANKARHRTDVQCKNRIDTLKKKYKTEKARVLDTNGGYKSTWPFFGPLDHLIGSSLPLKKVSPSPSPGPPMAVPLFPPRKVVPSVAPAVPVMVPQKRGSSGVVGMDDLQFRRNYAAVAAAAAASEETEEEEEDEEEVEREEEKGGGGNGEVVEGIRKLAKVIERFGEVYARVEAEKQRQMVELEKQRMQFAKELECQRMQMMVEMQVQLEKIKRAKRSDSNDMYR